MSNRITADPHRCTRASGYHIDRAIDELEIALEHEADEKNRADAKAALKVLRHE